MARSSRILYAFTRETWPGNLRPNSHDPTNGLSRTVSTSTQQGSLVTVRRPAAISQPRHTEQHFVHHWLVISAQSMRVRTPTKIASVCRQDSGIHQRYSIHRQSKLPGVGHSSRLCGNRSAMRKRQPQPTPPSLTACQITLRVPATRASHNQLTLSNPNQIRVMACRHLGLASVRP